MRKKDILELKKRLKKDHCTFTKMCGCYVNGEKHILLKFRESFLNLDDDEFFKYMEIAKKVLSGTIGNNILKLDFPVNESYINEKQISLMKLKNSKLKEDDLLDKFYESIIENYNHTGNFIILLFHDAYDVITKTTDNLKLDESEEVYEYILCALCPVSLSEAGLRYFEEENKIAARIREWVIDAPSNGFVFPAFIERSTDVNSVMYYTKNPRDPHPELMEGALGCFSKQTAAFQKETFQTIIKASFEEDEVKSEKIYMEVQDNLNNLLEEYNSTYEDTDAEPIALSKKEIQSLLIESGVPEEITEKIENSYIEAFGDELPLAENLIDTKVLKVKEQKRKEETLQKQVEILEKKLEQVTEKAPVEISDSSLEINSLPEDLIEEASTPEIQEENTKPSSNYDVILQVRPDKVPQIKAQIIDGQKYIVIPINDNEQAALNGEEHLI